MISRAQSPSSTWRATSSARPPSSPATIAGTPTQAVPTLKVYNGGIKHVLYIIKENRTYDEVFGDLPIGNGDPKLCSLGEKVMPNHRKIVREFTLFDNGYVSGTNSADGHDWATQCLANEYLEHFYVGYSRTYPDDGDDRMAISNAGTSGTPRPRRASRSASTASFATTSWPGSSPCPKIGSRSGRIASTATHKFKMTADTPGGLAEAVHQSRGPLLAALAKRPASRRRLHSRVPGIQPARHRSRPDDPQPSLRPFRGRRPQVSHARAMMADNDLALGRVVEAVSKARSGKRPASS